MLKTNLLLVGNRLKLPQFTDTDNGTGGDRTHGLSLRRRSLYPTELQPQESWELGVGSWELGVGMKIPSFGGSYRVYTSRLGFVSRSESPKPP
jgi:hypothetical protein